MKRISEKIYKSRSHRHFLIQIEIGEDFLTVSGHAEAGEKGNDIVCAAVSVIVTGAAEF